MTNTETAGPAAASPSQPAPTTIAEVVERIKALQPLLREHAAEGEAQRRVPDVVVDALRDAGAFRVSIPKRFGGFEGSMQDMLDVSSAAAYGDGGAAWYVALGNVCAWAASLGTRQLQDDIWGENPDAFVTGVLTPSSTATRVEGGYRVTGSWGYNSGSPLSDWALLGFPIPDEAGEIVSQGLAYIPRSDYEVQDTWFVAGMKASASNTIVATDVFVPDHRVFDVPPAILGQYANENAANEPAHRAALVPVLALVLIGPQLGLGRAAFDYVLERAGRKPVMYSSYERQADSVAVQMQLARAAQALDTAELHARRAASDIDTAALEGTYPDEVVRARVRADTALIAETITRTIDSLISIHGAASFADVSPLQRMWRDSNVAARHAVVSANVPFEVYGKTLLGIPPQSVTPLV